MCHFSCAAHKIIIRACRGRRKKRVGRAAQDKSHAAGGSTHAEATPRWHMGYYRYRGRSGAVLPVFSSSGGSSSSSAQRHFRSAPVRAASQTGATNTGVTKHRGVLFLSSKHLRERDKIRGVRRVQPGRRCELSELRADTEPEQKTRLPLPLAEGWSDLCRPDGAPG